MTTFCKTSAGGFNLDKVTQWYIEDGQLVIWLSGYDGNVQEHIYISASDPECERMVSILEGICIFDTTQDTPR